MGWVIGCWAATHGIVVWDCLFGHFVLWVWKRIFSLLFLRHGALFCWFAYLFFIPRSWVCVSCLDFLRRVSAAAMVCSQNL